MSADVFVCSEKNKIEMVQASDGKLRVLMEILKSRKRPEEVSEIVKDYILESGQLSEFKETSRN